MKTCIIIPARLYSTRLPEKVLADLGGKPMIQRVYEQAIKVRNVHKIIIATEDEKVFNVCNSFGAEVIMTSTSHQSGTDRIGEAAGIYNEFDFYINIQADEPLIDPLLIEEFNSFLISSLFPICTISESIKSEDDLFDFNVVKLVKNKKNQALYFSRNAIPAFRDKPYKDWFTNLSYFRHVGIYGFSKSALLEIIKLQPSTLEKAESLEQLRWLENGYNIGIMESNFFSMGIDTEEDLEKVREKYFN